MKILSTLVVSASLFTGALAAQGFDFGAGPFSLQFGYGDGNGNGDGNGGGYIMQQDTRADRLDNPICMAISHQQRLAITVVSKEIVSTKEKKVVIKKLIIEPYAFGTTQDGKPVLKGNVVEDKTVKEVSVTYGEDKFNKQDESKGNTPQKKGFFSGMFSSNSGSNIDISKIGELEIVENSHFDVPKDFKGFQPDDKVQIICELPTPSK